MPTLDQLPRGARARILDVTGDDGLSMRLLEMGVVEGEEIGRLEGVVADAVRRPERVGERRSELDEGRPQRAGNDRAADDGSVRRRRQCDRQRDDGHAGR